MREQEIRDARDWRKTMGALLLVVACLLVGPVGVASAVDSDGDGVDNAYDFDYNNDGVVDATDAALLQGAMGSEPGDGAYDESFDADGDGLIAGTDWAAFIAAQQ